MTLEEARARCLAAKLTVLDVATVGRQICVTTAPLPVGVDTLALRLGVAVTVSFGDGTGNVRLYFAGEGTV
jgi:hypothetical protein